MGVFDNPYRNGGSKAIKLVVCYTFILLVALVSFPMGAGAQDADDIKARVDDLVRKHYLHGIPYEQANMLGPDAVPYLLELLGSPDEKEFWVNIIVTIGFIEDNSAFDTLVAFLENTRGEVDDFTFRALMSIPFALGCIAGGEDLKSLNYLLQRVNAPSDVAWSFQGKDIPQLLAEQSVTGLAVSGKEEARLALLQLESDIKAGTETRTFLLEAVRDGLKIMQRINNEGRQNIFNPKR